MQYTSNFNFMIAEGTDTVNLLTQCYPNFTSLDSILQAIKESGVTTAVSTKTGTVHAIVRTDADCDVIRWVNTANYAAGDTFTVDGVSVTATAMDGTSLPAGAFVINQSSMAILNGTVLTFVGVPGVSSVAAQDVTYDNSGSGLTATDVQNAIDEVLGDIPTSLAASAITYDNSGSGLTATNAQDAIDELAANGLDWKLLGTYASATDQSWPANYSEVMFVIPGLTSNDYMYVNVLPKPQVDIATTTQRLIFGYGSTGATYAQINFDNTKFRLHGVYNGGTNLTSTATVTVYYR